MMRAQGGNVFDKALEVELDKAGKTWTGWFKEGVGLNLNQKQQAAAFHAALSVFLQ
ncbi:MAG: hypothetical protein K0R24_2312, partial [Gammaproteobacteria bacterium]|nr:hypothetical protein [Gammaproteobacteria bacterium]